MENLDLIDWQMVGFSSLWILGLALLLTVLGFAYDETQREKTRLLSTLKRAGYQVPINLGLVLFCAGLAGSAGSWWETVLWGLLGFSFLTYGWRSWQEYKHREEEVDAE